MPWPNALGLPPAANLHAVVEADCIIAIASVVALDVNPNAALAAAENAHASGLDQTIVAAGSNLFSALRPGPLFDVILSSPSSFAGEPRDLADRAWHAGPDYRDIAILFVQARERLASGGCMYVLFSSDSDLDLLGGLISRAGFVARLVAERTILIESIILFELTLRCWTFHSHCTSTTLADLLTPLLAANPFSAMRASLRR
jgi:hypothetical protein